MMSAKMATPALLKIKVLFWNKSYDVMIYLSDIIDKFLKILFYHYIVDVVMWSKFGNWRISIREVIIISIL